MFRLKLIRPAAAVAALLAAAPAMAQQAEETDTNTPLADAETVAWQDWGYSDLYSQGISAERVFGWGVHGENGERIGDVEDFLIGPDGQVVALMAEIGGFIDIGDTHVSIPFDEVNIMPAAQEVSVPLTEDTVHDYDFESSYGSTFDPGEEIAVETDDEAYPRNWRASELIGDYARLNGEEAAPYGYVTDLVIGEGEVAAVVVERAAGYGRGYGAYPYYGYNAGYGWTPGSAHYNMPYTADQAAEFEEFDYDNFQSDAS